MFEIRDLLVATKNRNHTGYVTIRIKCMIDSTVKKVSIGVTIRSKKAEAIHSTIFHNN